MASKQTNRGQPCRYSPLTVELPPHLKARLQAASVVLKVPVPELVEAALALRVEGLDRQTLELIDRFAAETLRRSEP